jgi:hypothetical protein
MQACLAGLQKRQKTDEIRALSLTALFMRKSSPQMKTPRGAFVLAFIRSDLN